MNHIKWEYETIMKIKNVKSDFDLIKIIYNIHHRGRQFGINEVFDVLETGITREVLKPICYDGYSDDFGEN